MIGLALSSALAMSVQSQSSVIAWSDHGDAALIRQDMYGPEGGGSVDYSVVRLGPDGVRWDQAAISNDMSPGDGSTPEHIAASDCADAAKRLQDALTGFKGVTVTPLACHGDRGKVVHYAGARPVVRDDHAPKGVPEGRWIDGGGDLLVSFGDQGVDVWRKVGDRYEAAKNATIDLPR